MTFIKSSTNFKFHKHQKQLLLLVSFCLICFMSCTENPFWKEDEISVNSIRGKVKLENSCHPENVYIWLETFDISTRTNEHGIFELVIPSPEKQPGGGIDGFYNLYIYVANYHLYLIELAFSNGIILLSENVFNNNGDLKAAINLSEIVNITTSFTVDRVSEGNQVTLLAFFTVTVKSKPVVLTSYISNRLFQSDSEYLAGFLVDENEKFIKILELEDRRYRVVNWEIKNQTLTLPPVLFTSDSLVRGKYKVIPYMNIWYDNLPSGLIESLDMKQHSDYLKIPLKINNNEFQL